MRPKGGRGTGADVTEALSLGIAASRPECFCRRGAGASEADLLSAFSGRLPVPASSPSSSSRSSRAWGRTSPPPPVELLPSQERLVRVEPKTHQGVRIPCAPREESSSVPRLPHPPSWLRLDR